MITNLDTASKKSDKSTSPTVGTSAIPEPKIATDQVQPTDAAN